MDTFYQDDYLIDSRDIDLFGHCRPSALLGHLQEGATQAAAAIGLSHRACTEQYNAFWMLVRIRYQLRRPLRWGETLTVKTWHRGARAAMSYREFDLLVGEETVGRALSVWVLADWQSRQLVKLGALKELAGTDGGSLCRTDTLHRPKAPARLTSVGQRRLNYSDTVINGHINNIHYADYACDALALEQLGRGKFVSALQIDYLRECMPGETVELFTGESEDGSRYVAGRDGEGQDRFDALVTLADL